MPKTLSLPLHAMYINGLNRATLSRGERKAIQRAAKDGIFIEHFPVDWFSDETFEDLLGRTTTQAKNELQKYGALLLIGASAGGSLAINAYGRLHNPDIRVITLCSRLHEPGLPWWDIRSLERMAHIGTDRESRNFLDSVNYCQNTTLPALTNAEKARIITVRQWMDEVVPRPTMNVDSLPAYTVPGFEHHYGIVSGVRHLKAILSTEG